MLRLNIKIDEEFRTDNGNEFQLHATVPITAMNLTNV